MVVDLNKTAAQTGITDIETLKMLFNEFFKVCQKDIDLLPKSISDANFEEIRGYAHDIKGAARNLRMEEIGIASETLEYLAKNSQLDGMAESYAKLLKIYNVGKDEFNNLG